MSLLVQNSTQSERMRGCVFSENFENASAIVKNGGLTFGTPTINFGADLNGTTDYISYNLAGSEFNSAELSIVCEFVPEFEADDGVSHYFLSSISGGDRLIKFSDNALSLNIGGSSATVSLVNYQAYWKVNQRNVFVLVTTSGDTKAYLNGVTLSISNPTSAWTPSEQFAMNIGARHTGIQWFDGSIKTLKMFHSLLTAQEASDYYNNDTYTYMQDAVVNLPMTAAYHDPTNLQALDISGNHNNATFGDGSTSSTYPTKLTKRGYSTDGADYMQTGTDLFVDTGQMSWAMTFSCTNFNIHSLGSIEKGDLSDVGCLFLLVSSSDNLRFYTGDATNYARAPFSKGDIGQYHTVVGVYDGVNTKLYLNGIAGTDAASPQPPGITADMLLSLFVRGNGIQSISIAGTKIFSSTVFDKALTPLQVADLHLQMMQEVNYV